METGVQPKSSLAKSTDSTNIDPLAVTRGSFSAPTRSGPLAGRIKKKPAEPADKPTPAKKPPKPKRPPVKRLRFFACFDDRGFHPTLNFAFRESDMSLWQCWRHKQTDEPEWRPVPTSSETHPTTSTISSDSPNSAAAAPDGSTRPLTEPADEDQPHKEAPEG